VKALDAVRAFSSVTFMQVRASLVPRPSGRMSPVRPVHHQLITTQTSALWAEATFSGLRLRRQEVLEGLTKRDGVTAATKAVAGLEGAAHEQALGRRVAS